MNIFLHHAAPAQGCTNCQGKKICTGLHLKQSLTITKSEGIMKNHCLRATLAASLLALCAPLSAADALWHDVALKAKLTDLDQLNVNAKHYRLLGADINKLQSRLLNRSQNTFELDLPLPDGTMARFSLRYSPIYQPGLAKKYPSIRTFEGHQIGNPDNRGRFDITPHGFHGMFRQDKQMVYIDPLQRGNNKTYISYFSEDAVSQGRMEREAVISSATHTVHSAKKHAAKAAGETLKSYRTVVAAAGEYTQFHGGTKADGQAAIVTMMNRVNEVYEVDLSVRLVLVSNNDEVVFTDPNTDPYDNTDGDIDVNQQTIDNAIGNANYDVGHIVNTSGGGLAGLGVVCNESFKAEGITGLGNPTGDPFYIDYVAHEFGHQFGAPHSFNGQEEACANRSAEDAYEPGSGSTIMAYASLCGSQNLQNASDPYFHVKSIERIHTYMAGGGNCHTTTDLNNEAPQVTVGGNMNIPKSTPLMLSGSATDPDGDTLTYSWEQVDLGEATNNAEEMVDGGNKPLFRVWPPTDNGMRYLPRLDDIVSGNTRVGETMATTFRHMNFTLLVRDGKGNIGKATQTLIVDGDSGPFTVTAPSAGASWTDSNNPTVTWNTANTQNSPVSCANVDIMLSTDGGQTFSQTVVAGTANDGSEAVTAPAANTSTARLMVKCSDNVFYAINDGNFSVNASGSGGGGGGDNQAPVITGQNSLSMDEDNALAIQLSDLMVSDADNTYPDDFTLTIGAGNNYTVSATNIMPDANFNGQLTVPVTVNDGTVNSNTFDLAVTVVPVNDAPVISAQSTVVIDEDNSLALTLDHLTVSDVDNSPNQMSVVIMAGENYSFDGTTVTPAANFNGQLSVNVAVSDGLVNSDTLAFAVTVNAINDAPVAQNDTASVTHNASATNINVLGNDSDVDGDSLSVVGVNYNGSGTLTIGGGGLIYTPANGFSGSESATYTVSDGNGATAEGTVTITVSAQPSSDSGGGGGSIPPWLLLLVPMALARRTSSIR